MLRAFLKSLVPPIILNAVRGRAPSGPTLVKPYTTWREATEQCGSYEDTALIESVFRRNLSGQTAEPVVLTDRDLQVLAAVFLALARTGLPDNRVVDYGGEFGGFYRTMRRLSANLPISKWTVVETPKMIERAAVFAEGALEFISDIPSRAEIILASGALQCVEDPARVFQRLAATNATAVILSIVPLVSKVRHTITAGTGSRNYPLWMFSDHLFRRMIDKNFTIIAEWDVPKHDTMHDNTSVRYGGFLLERKPELPPRHPTGWV